MFNTLLVHPLFNLLAVIYALIPGHDFGVSIIILTVLLRLLLWPLVRKQLHSQRAMQALAPEITKVRQKAKGDKQKESQLLMELYREKGISPFASLIPLLIQLPLLFALFIVLRDIVKAGEIARLAYEPVKQLPAIKEVITNSAAFKTTLFGLLDLAKPNVIIAILSGIAQFFQTRQITPKATAGDNGAKAASAMTYIFPGLTALIALSLPAALALYWTVTSLVSIGQQHLILKQDVEEMEQTNDKTQKSNDK